MSGSGSGTPDFGPTEPVDCAELAFEAAIASPHPDVVASLTQGEILTVELDTSSGRNRVLVRTNRGDVAGALISGRIAELLRCLQEGVAFEAEVTGIDGGDVTIHVRHA